MKLIAPATAIAVVGAGALLGFPGWLRADEAARDAVEKLMPDLMSADDAVRGDAEKKLAELGEPGRAELERITRDSDARRAVTALRLLQTPETRRSTKDGEKRVHRSDGSSPDPSAREERDEDDGADPFDRMDEWRAQMEREMEDLRRQFGGMQFRMPDFDMNAQSGEVARGKSSGTVVENEKRTTWNVEEDGRVKVTVKDGKDAEERTYEAKSLDELKKEHPDVAKRVEALLPRAGRAFTFRFGAPGSRRFLRDGERDGGFRPFLDGEQRRLVEAAPQQQVLGIEWSPLPDVLRDQLDLKTGVVVETVAKGSLAEKLGLERFDVLSEIQGKPVDDSQDVRAALESAKAGDKVTAAVVRKGQRKTLEATK
jgi:hypothetical protein